MDNGAGSVLEVGQVDAGTQREILKLEEGLHHALMTADLDWLKRAFVPDAMYVHMSGGVDGVSDFVERLASRATVYLERENGDVKVRRYGDTVVVTGYSNIRFVMNGLERSLAMRFTRVYVRENGKWLIATSQSGANTAQFPDGPHPIGGGP